MSTEEKYDFVLGENELDFKMTFFFGEFDTKDFVEYLNKISTKKIQKNLGYRLKLCAMVTLIFIGGILSLYLFYTFISYIFGNPKDILTNINLKNKSSFISFNIIYTLGILLLFLISSFIYYVSLKEPDWDQLEKTKFLFNNLKVSNKIDNYVYRKINFFYLKRISKNWELDWIYPFIFNSLPPLVYEYIGSTIFIIFIIFLIFFPMIQPDFVFYSFVLSSILMLSLLVVFKIILDEYRSFTKIKNNMILMQKKEIIDLVSNGNLSDLDYCYHNLDRLKSQNFPSPFFFKILPILPVLTSLITFIVSNFLLK